MRRPFSFQESASAEVAHQGARPEGPGLALAAPAHAVDEPPELRRRDRDDVQVRTALMEERERLYGVLQQFDFLEPYPSQANFILCSVRYLRQIALAQHDMIVHCS